MYRKFFPISTLSGVIELLFFNKLQLNCSVAVRILSIHSYGSWEGVLNWTCMTYPLAPVSDHQGLRQPSILGVEWKKTATHFTEDPSYLF